MKETPESKLGNVDREGLMKNLRDLNVQMEQAKKAMQKMKKGSPEYITAEGELRDQEERAETLKGQIEGKE
jgi:hypothetical protein